MTYLKSIITCAGLLGLVAAGCGATAVPFAKLTEAKSTVRAAQEAGAQNTPQAELHLKMANDELAAAQKAINDNDNEHAQLLLNQAQSDADLSLALARGSDDARAAKAAQARIADLAKQPQ